MKTIIDVSNNEEIAVTRADLPMLVHGKEHSGASLFPITVASQLHMQGNKLLIFTAYPMAKDEFLEQVGEVGNTVLYLENEADMITAGTFQTIIIQSGNEVLFLKAIQQLSNIQDYIPFIKNVEIVSEPGIIEYALSKPCLLAGDVEQSAFSEKLRTASYTTRVLFTPLDTEFVIEKYQAKMITLAGEKTVSVK